MNISPLTGMTPGAVPQIIPSQPAKHNAQEGDQLPHSDKETKDQKRRVELDKERDSEKKKVAVIKAEDLVMKPSPTTLEERLTQIISEKDVKDILSLVTGAPLPKKNEDHKVDVKR
jgi:hypothetical protein